jgi:hypothetical protein
MWYTVTSARELFTVSLELSRGNSALSFGSPWTQGGYRMPQTLIFNQTKSHWYDWYDEGEWEFASSDQGTDTFVFTIPEGSRFARYSVDLKVASAGSGCIVEYQPDPGDRGRQIVRTRWWYNPFGKIRYTISVYAGDPEIVPIYHGENNWTGKVVNTIQQEQDIDLSERGRIAKKLFSRMMRMSGKPIPHHFYSKPERASLSVSSDITLGLIASEKYGAIGGILLFALNSGYSVSAKFHPHGVFPFRNELVIEMRKK